METNVESNVASTVPILSPIPATPSSVSRVPETVLSDEELAARFEETLFDSQDNSPHQATHRISRLRREKRLETKRRKLEKYRKF